MKHFHTTDMAADRLGGMRISQIVEKYQVRQDFVILFMREAGINLTIKWTDERNFKLKAMIGAGVGYKIAAENLGVTRNAAIGQHCRLMAEEKAFIPAPPKIPSRLPASSNQCAEGECRGPPQPGHSLCDRHLP